MEPLRVAICEDMQQECQHLLTLVQNSPIPTSCTVFASGEQLLNSFVPHSFDIVLMDIYMEGINGIDTVKKLREIQPDIPVAFTTSSIDYALESCRLSALRYMEKPVKQKDVDEVLELVQLKKDNQPCFVLSINGTTHKVPFGDIVYLEQQGHHVFVWLWNGEILQAYDKLSSFLPQFQGQLFFQPHKSFLVNLAFVRQINPELHTFVLKNKANIPITRPNTNKAKKAYEEFLFRRTREGR